MKLNRRTVIWGVVIAVLVAGLIVFNFVNIHYSDDVKTAQLAKNCIIRAFCAALAVCLAVLSCDKRLFNPLNNDGKHSIFWCLPCLLVAIVNFPFTAIFGGTATVDRTELIGLFILNCILIGMVEEFLFRGILQDIAFKFFSGYKMRHFLTVLATSAVFGLWHIFNLFDGAGIGATVMQIGYSFLIGAMLSTVILRTGNIWLCVILHALFDFGGLLIPTLGDGPFQDATFWALTVAAGVLCTAHVVLYILKRDGIFTLKSKNAPDVRANIQ